MTGKTLGAVGAGNMGGAILRGVIKAGLYGPEEITVCDLIPEKAETLKCELGIEVVPTAAEVAQASSTLLLAVKPQTMEECLIAIKDSVRPSQNIISIAAGITTGFIEDRLGSDIRVVRVMPNTPALVGAGATAISSGRNAHKEDIAVAERIFSALGKVYRLDESLIDAVTAVSGSGPAYLFLFAEYLEHAALKVGLPQSEAADLVAQTLFGAAKLLVESDESPASLRAMVTSPGGTTEAAIAIFKEKGFEKTVIAAVTGALERALELGGAKKK